MRDKIITAAIELLLNFGLSFHVEKLTEKLGISKKTVYKYFRSKEELALAVYEKFYAELTAETKERVAAYSATRKDSEALLELYFKSKLIVREEIFNKYNINLAVRTYALKLHDGFGAPIAEILFDGMSAEDAHSYKTIIDGTFEKLISAGENPDKIIKTLAGILWRNL